MRTAICPSQLHYHDLMHHFLTLGSGDRLLRFGRVVTDLEIVDYVERLFVSAAHAFVVVEPDRDISGVLHLEFTDRGVVLGLSVSSWARSEGIGTLLLQRAGLLARARSLGTLFVRNLSLNTALQRLALRLGMNVARSPDASCAPLEAPAPNAYGSEHDGFGASITLADDSLRCQGSFDLTDVTAFDRAERVLS
jgi:hypothetical protein